MNFPQCIEFFISFEAALSTAALQLNTVIDGAGPPRDGMGIPGGAGDSIPKQTVCMYSNVEIENHLCPEILVVVLFKNFPIRGLILT